MRTRIRAALVLGLVALFVLISAGLARMLAANGAEHSALTDLVKAEARGDAGAIARRVDRCAPGCAALARRLRRAGAVEVLRLDPSSRISLAGTSGTTRVAWRAGSSLPVVQCVGLRRTGDLFAGFRIELESLGAPIGREAACSR